MFNKKLWEEVNYLHGALARCIAELREAKRNSQQLWQTLFDHLGVEAKYQTASTYIIKKKKVSKSDL